jgi:Ca2+-dependent lipid-binding protein
VVARISVSEHMQQKTEVKKHTLHPKWENEEIVLVVHEPKFQEITAMVYDWDRLSQDNAFCQ